MTWRLLSWKEYTQKHIPLYHYDIANITLELNNKPPLVSHVDINNLQALFTNIINSNSFIVQIGECAETFAQANIKDIASRLQLINAFSNMLSTNKNIIKIGRIAGQYSKPRSTEYEIINDKKIPVYKGDMAHSFTHRELNPLRLLSAYNAAKTSIEIIKTLDNYLFTSHEALNLYYESSLTKQVDSKYYNLSTHMLWLGERTRFLGSAHVEYLRGIANPIGIKVSSTALIPDLIEIIKTINPQNIVGRIILIVRFGSKNIVPYLHDLIYAIKEHNLSIIWMSDPMHGNTVSTKNNFKTRFMHDIIEEVEDFVSILKKYNVYFAGIHLEATPLDVYECLDNTDDSYMIDTNYQSLCDPRLNTKQALQIAHLVKKLIS